MKLYRYVGPEETREAVKRQPPGVAIKTAEQLRSWLRQASGARGGELIATFVVSAAGVLRLADRHSEHIACSGGRPVLSAGEVTFQRRGEESEVTAISNLSTGFCPEPSSWAAVVASFSSLDVALPERWTDAFIFRRCVSCGQRSVVKDDWFVCVMCDADLPERWNFDD